MKCWYVEILELKKVNLNLQILFCYDEWLLLMMFDVDGLLVGYGNIVFELLVKLIEVGKVQNYIEVCKVFEQFLLIICIVYYCGLYMEGMVVLKLGLVKCGILDYVIICELLKNLGEKVEKEIFDVFDVVGVGWIQEVVFVVE